jgi:hypothetical protein
MKLIELKDEDNLLIEFLSKYEDNIIILANYRYCSYHDESVQSECKSHFQIMKLITSSEVVSLNNILHFQMDIKYIEAISDNLGMVLCEGIVCLINILDNQVKAEYSYRADILQNLMTICSH